MTTELVFRVTVRGIVTPEQWHRLLQRDPEMIKAMEDLFQERLTAHMVEIHDVQIAADMAAQP